MPFTGPKKVLAGSTLTTAQQGFLKIAWYSKAERLLPAVQMGG